MAGEESHEVKRRRVDRERVVRTLTFWLRPEFVLRVVNRFQKVAGFDRSVALASSALTATIPLAILTSWDRPRATDGSVRTGNAPTTTCSALSEALVSASTAGTRARSKKRTPSLLRFVQLATERAIKRGAGDGSVRQAAANLALRFRSSSVAGVRGDAPETTNNHAYRLSYTYSASRDAGGSAGNLAPGTGAARFAGDARV
jgi:hypothetical protein